MVAAIDDRSRIGFPVLRRALLWLVFLAPFFYLTYGLANWYASLQPDVGSIVFSWERSVPFIAWSILPYWSINLFYGLSLLLNRAPSGVDRLAARYLTAQLVACACFVVFPLAASFVRPETDGLPGFMFDALTGFDRPFNQAPSLHIALLVIIWDHIRRLLSRPIRIAWHIWCVLIGASVLTTFQHHFIDIPTGALLGLFALWLFPREGEMPFAGFRMTQEANRRRLAAYYGVGALACLAAAWIGASQQAVWLLLLWPALSLALVAVAYLGAGPKVFQKRGDGTLEFPSRLLLLPYRVFARLDAWAWTRRLPSSVPIADGVWLGRFPNLAEAAAFATVVDLAAEFERPRRAASNWFAVPMLDLVTPPQSETESAVRLIDEHRHGGPLLVCCALGFQRSATAVANWLIETGHVQDFDAAEELIRSAGRPVHLKRPRSVE